MTASAPTAKSFRSARGAEGLLLYTAAVEPHPVSHRQRIRGRVGCCITTALQIWSFYVDRRSCLSHVPSENKEDSGAGVQYGGIRQ